MAHWSVLSIRHAFAVLFPALASVAPADGVLSRYEFDQPPADRWELPRTLDEISGLALDAAGRLYAHGDEKAEIVRLDPKGHEIAARFSFGDPTVHGDFEGITFAGDRIFLVTSDGVLYAGRPGTDGQHMQFVTYATGLGQTCEVEGLAYDPVDSSLLLACKEARSGLVRHRLAIFRWSIDRRALFPRPAVLISSAPIANAIGEKAFHPSDITLDAATGHYLVLASREHAIAEVTPAGEVVKVSLLRRSLHRQAEGIAIDRDGSLIVADEAAGKKGTLTTYARAE